MADSVSADALHLLRLILDTSLMRELSVAEQRYQAVLAVISDGLSICQVASKVGVSRQTLHAWLARYEAEGLDGLADRSHRPVSCPHQMPAAVEAARLELRRSRPYWGPRRLVFELAKRGVEPVPSESTPNRRHRSVRRPTSRFLVRVIWSRVGGIELRCRDVAKRVTIDDPAKSAAHNESKVPPIPTHAEAQANPEILRAFNAAVVEEFRSNRGRVGGPFANSDVLLLTMTGAKSGQRRQTPLEYFTVDARILIVGTSGGAPRNPAWVHNLRASAAAHVEIGVQSYDVVAQEITGEERDDLYQKAVALYPRIGTYSKPDRVIPLFELRRV
jgi:deazaflavin-dependent oxidoreductase (nitroreductase family)